MNGIGLATDGYYGGGSGGGGAPTISNITPLEDVTAGEPGAFSGVFRAARLTPITFHLADIADGCAIAITVKYENRNDTIVARDASGAWVWPFDVQADNTMSAVVGGEADVSMRPRGGWPPTRIEFKVAAAFEAVS